MRYEWRSGDVVLLPGPTTLRYPAHVKRATPHVLLVFLTLTALQAHADGPDWEKVRQEDGITVWRWTTPERDLPVLRGRARVAANIYQVLGILQDFDRHCEWMHGCKEARLLKQFNDFHRVSYNRTEIPWPFDDRDVVLDSKVKVIPATHTVLIRFRGVSSPLKGEVDGVVRMQRLHGYYKLTATSATETIVQYQVDTDPGGALPKWMVAIATIDLPWNTLNNLRRQVRKTDGQYQAFIDRWDPAKGRRGTPVLIY